MNTSTKRYLLIAGAVVAVIAIALGGWFGYRYWQNRQASSGTTISVNGGFVANPSIQPSLDRPLNFPASFPANAQKILSANVATLRASITKNPSDFSSWLDLAIQYKTIGDYEGARLIWEYLNVAAPGQSVSFQNLGDLYGNYLKEYSKSEQNYLTAIKNAPQQLNPYLGLFQLYRYSYKQDTNAAADILKQGIAAIPAPQHIDLVIALAGYYKDSKDVADAKKYYAQALREAQTLNSTSIEAQIQTELNALK